MQKETEISLEYYLFNYIKEACMIYILMLLMITILGGLIFGEGAEGGEYTVVGCCRLLFMLPVLVFCMIPAIVLICIKNEEEV